MTQEEYEKRAAEAVARKQSGKFNCAQAVTTSFADAAGLDPELAMRLSASFGTGMGCLKGTCGAIVGAGIITGLVSSDRMEAMRRMKTFMEAFHTKNGSTRCQELKGVGTGKPLRPCLDCVADACELLYRVSLDSSEPATK